MASEFAYNWKGQPDSDHERWKTARDSRQIHRKRSWNHMFVIKCWVKLSRTNQPLWDDIEIYFSTWFHSFQMWEESEKFYIIYRCTDFHFSLSQTFEQCRNANETIRIARNNHNNNKNLNFLSLTSKLLLTKILIRYWCLHKCFWKIKFIKSKKNLLKERTIS